MKISDERIAFLSKEIATSLIASGVCAGGGLTTLSQEVMKGFNFFIQKELLLDTQVREKIATLKRGVSEGSSEWDILYRQYYNEALSKL